MQTLQKYILSLVMFVVTVSMYAMDGCEQQASSLQAIVARQGQAELEQASSLQNVVATQAPLKASKKLNLQSDILSVDLLKNEILEYLVGSSGDTGDTRHASFTIDRKVRPWMLIDQQRIAIVQGAKKDNYEQFKKSCELLDVYTLLFISPKAQIDLRLKKALPRQESFDFIKNYKNRYGKTLLHIAALHENVDVVSLLFDRGMNVDTRDNDGRTSLFISAECQYVDLMKLLLDRGATIDTRDNYGNTSLHDSARNENVELVRLLLDRGANVDTQDNDGRTPLYASAWNGNVKIVRLLLDRGANVDIPNNDGRTPLYVSGIYGNVEVVRLLLDRGANIDTLNKDGRTLNQITSNQEIKTLIAQARIDRVEKAALKN